MTERQYRILAGCSFLLAFVPAFNYVMTHFFVTGGFFLDSARVAWLLGHSTSWPLADVPMMFWQGPYNNVHIVPFFLFTSALFQALTRLFGDLHDTVYFALFNGVASGLIAWALFSMLAGGVYRLTRTYFIAALILGVVAVHNGAVLLMCSRPHYEIGIVALMVLFFKLFIDGRSIAALVSLTGALLLQEWVGFQMFLLLAPLVVIMALHRGDDAFKRRAMVLALFSFGCLVYAMLATGYHLLAFAGVREWRNLYQGDPAWAHLTDAFIRERLVFYYQFRACLWAPAGMILVYAAARRDMVQLCGLLAFLPWALLTMAAVNTDIGIMHAYFAAPAVFVIVWPIVANALNRELALKDVSGWFAGWGFPALVILASLVTWSGMDGHSLDPQPWRNFGFGWYGNVDRNITGVKAFMNANSELSYFADDPSASLDNENFTVDHWLLGKYWELQKPDFPYAELKDYDTLVMLPAYLYQKKEILKVINGLQLHFVCRVDDTDFLAYSRRRDLKHCTPIQSAPRVPLAPTR
ncbi:MAG: hypothetical protein LBR29_05000 [Methylobacteriaceae bacterium]|jgi:hypothetical protein|nr:hypothetical protein [Methylobacteriaceae bacterium]